MITKKILGIGLAIMGGLALIGLLSLDFVRPTDFTGIGPLQRIALWVSTITLLIGLTLIPLGDRPA